MHDGTLVRQYNAAEFESDYKSFMNDILMKGIVRVRIPAGRVFVL